MKALQLIRALLFSILTVALVSGCASTGRGTAIDRAGTHREGTDRSATPQPAAADPSSIGIPAAESRSPSGAARDRDLPPDLPPDLSPAEREQWRLYIEAVQATKYPQPSAVSRDLLAIVKYDPKLMWNDQGQIRMVTWTKASYFPPDTVGKPQNLYGDTWLTAAPFTQEFCRDLGLRGEALNLRLKQYIGLPPNDDKDAFVEMWVDPRHFFRPCPDPEINDHECQVSLGVDAVQESAICPWASLLASTQPPVFEIRFDQVSLAFAAVADTHLQWMCANWVGSYPAQDPRKGYPWTALGYTYDWGSPDHVGSSEFVAPAKTPVVIVSVTPTEEYCAPPG